MNYFSIWRRALRDYLISKEGVPMLTIDKTTKAFADASSIRIDEFTEVFNEHAEKFGITKEVHVNFFLAQIREEVGLDLEPKRENLNYSCKALRAIFGYYMKSKSESNIDGRCKGHSANRVNIGNKAYAGRLGNGTPETGDGYRFRGGGYIQLTGRSNYIMASEVITLALGNVFTPEDVEKSLGSTRGALLTAMAFWAKNRLYECTSIDDVTAKINKYTDSYGKRRRHYKYIASL